MQEIQASHKYEDQSNIELIKYCITKIAALKDFTPKHLFQLGCELLKLNDPEGVLKVFDSFTNKNSEEAQEIKEIKLLPEFQFNMALALTEVGGKEN